MRLSLTLIAAPILLLSSSLAISQEVAKPPMPSDSLGEVLAGLALVLLLIFALAWLLRRFGAQSAFGARGMKVVASLPLGTRERLVLVQAGDRQLLLGVAPGRVNLLDSFDQPLIDVAEPEAANFSERLREALQRRPKS